MNGGCGETDVQNCRQVPRRSKVFLERGCETPDEAVPILASELYRDWGTKFTKYRAQFAVHFVSPHFATRPAVRSARMTTAAQQDVDNAFYAHARHT